MRMRWLTLCLVLAGVSPTPAFAQLLAAKDGPIVYSHHHLSASDVDAQKKFWATLGGVPVKLGGGVEAVRLPNVYIMFVKKAPTAGSKGSTVDHLGLQVPDLRATVNTLRAAGYPIVTEAEMPAGVKGELRDGIFVIPAGKTAVAFVMGPEGTKLEILETPGMALPISLHHIHFLAQDTGQVKAWYDKVFGAKLPGVSLLYLASTSTPAPTKGRATDHIGFEVRNLEAFCKRLDEMGIKFDRPYARIPGTDIGVAFFTDPWGTAIEVSEGLREVP